MMNCEQFEEVQLDSLLGEATLRERQRAAGHARACQPCREVGVRDRLLETAFTTTARAAEQGFERAHRRLWTELRERRAYCCSVEGPFGPIYLAKTERGVCRISFRSERDFLRELEENALLPEFDADRFSRESREIERYFEGRCKRFSAPLDLRLTTAFQRRVLQAAARIPFGQLASYSDVARQIGQPGARRAVGQALGSNPIAIIIPCHRVVAADGSIGGYTGGVQIKRHLLNLEGVDLAEERR
jgi:methylated-DNA-[protein]-cysteine S-methyltransferase